MSEQPANPSITSDQGLDRKRLKTLSNYFLAINQERLQRAREALPARHRQFLDQLPMLFHVNHPMLPGYVSHQTPAGLSDYNPDKTAITRTQQLARSFTYHRQPAMERNIHSLFLIGSCGSIGHSRGSDLDIWVCHAPTISAIEHQLLKQKTDAISQWASTLGLEAHFFLMEGEQFRSGQRQQLDAEDCGSSQHALLLDEFYRSGLLVAGRFPLWWIIPSSEDKNYDNYANTLRNKRYISADASVDFGTIDQIPAGEFIGAGVWQLYKAIDSPYKSVLKLLLTEAYAAEYPKVKTLSQQFKQAVHDEQLNIDELDPYVMIYRKLESYLLKRKEYKRLELVRRCFYFKVGLRLSFASPNRRQSWQWQLMEKLTREWQWPREHIHNLDTRKQWKVGKVIEEQKALVRELTNSYRFLKDFAQRNQVAALIHSEEMTVLGRKLYAAYERRAGKVEWINPDIAGQLTEENLCFYLAENSHSNQPTWVVGRDFTSNKKLPADKHGIKQSDSLLSLLTWCHYNGLYDAQTRITVKESNHQVTAFELGNLARHLSQQLPQAKQYGDASSAQHNRFKTPQRTTHIQLYINVGIDPMAAMQKQGIVRLSNQIDSLGYSGLRENLVANIEQISVNSWGEISCRQYEGNNALIRCLRDYLLMIPPGSDQRLPQLEVQCFCPQRAEAIRQRVEILFRDVIACYYSGTRPTNTRYLLEVQREFYLLQFIDNKPNFECVGSYLSLLQRLGQAQQAYSPIELDRYCLKDSVLAAICQHSSANNIQVFFQPKGESADIFIIDELGSLNTYSADFHNEKELLLPLQQFLNSILFRRQSEATELLSYYGQRPPAIEFYRLSNFAGKPATKPCALNEQLDPQQRYFFNVQAIAQRDQRGKISFNIYCDQQEFLALEYGEDLYNAVARFILSRRRSRERYPCFITDLDLSHCADLASGNNPNQPTQTIHYLQHKQTLEKALNAALSNL
jgi:adenylate cyclase class 1